MRKVILSLFALAMVLFSLFGCSSKDAEDAVTEPQEEGVVEDVFYNPLTGEAGYSEESLYLRPVAIQINNIEVATPQDGISEADIIFEVVAEGGITRMNAVFADYTTVPQIGSVRSARTYYLYWAMGMNAMFVHFGQSYEVTDYIAATGIITINGDYLYDNVFFLDAELAAERGGTEHAWFTNAELIQVGIDMSGIETTQPDGAQTESFFQFSYDTEISLSGTATSVSVPFSSYNTSYLDYDSVTKTYIKSQFGSEQIDRTTGEALSFTNAFVLFTDIYGDYLQTVEMDEGEGYYFTMGTYQEIRWVKGDEEDSFKFYDAVTGAEITVNVGKSYIAMVDYDQMYNFTIE